MDPTTSASELGRLAFDFPEEVLANPAVALLSLSDPSTWMTIQVFAAVGLTEREVERLAATGPPAALHQFAADCVRHALEAVAARNPDATDDCMKVLEIVGRRVQGLTSSTEVEGAMDLVAQLSDRLELPLRGGQSWSLEHAVMSALSAREPRRAAMDAATFSADLVFQVHADEREAFVASQEERHWQLSHLEHLLTAELVPAR